MENGDKSNEDVKVASSVTDTPSNVTLNQKELMYPNPTANANLCMKEDNHMKRFRKIMDPSIPQFPSHVAINHYSEGGGGGGGNFLSCSGLTKTREVD